MQKAWCIYMQFAGKLLILIFCNSLSSYFESFHLFSLFPIYTSYAYLYVRSNFFKPMLIFSLLEKLRIPFAHLDPIKYFKDF